MMKPDIIIIVKKFGDRVSVQFGQEGQERVTLVSSLGVLERAKQILMNTHAESDFGRKTEDSRRFMVDSEEMANAISRLSPEVLKSLQEKFAGNGNTTIDQKLPVESEEEDSPHLSGPTPPEPKNWRVGTKKV